MRLGIGVGIDVERDGHGKLLGLRFGIGNKCSYKIVGKKFSASASIRMHMARE